MKRTKSIDDGHLQPKRRPVVHRPLHTTRTAPSLVIGGRVQRYVLLGSDNTTERRDQSYLRLSIAGETWHQQRNRRQRFCAVQRTDQQLRQ